MNLLTGILISSFAMLESLTKKILFVFTFVLHAMRKLFQSSTKYSSYPCPPQPDGSCAFFGHLGRLGNSPHLKYTELAQEYGPIYQIFMGPKRTVVISDYALIREAFKQPVFSGRPDTELTKLVAGFGKYKIYFKVFIYETFLKIP